MMVDMEVTITGEGQRAPDISGTLTKNVAKDELVPLDKGKTKLELPNLET